MLSPEIDLSVVIITLNEEATIERCLRSLPAGVEIIVVDSQSSDKTCEIAAANGARVVQHDFRSYGQQKNYACSLATRRWIFSIDADEEIDPSLREWLAGRCGSRTSSGEIFRFRRRLVFMGKTMKFGKSTDHPIRLFLRGNHQFVGDIHEKVATESAMTPSMGGGVIYHHSYKDLSDYFSRFNRYTTEIARAHYTARKKCFFPAHVFRPWFEFFYRYCVLGGFLDGYPGYTYALVSSLYTYVKYSKLIELYKNDR